MRTAPSVPSAPSPLRSLLTRGLRAYESVQVELRGSYSVERMLELLAFASSHSLAWCLVVLVVTPLPCVVVAILVDAVPLHPSSMGLAHSHWFWWRVALVSGCVTFTILEQLRVFVPRLSHTSQFTVVWMTVVIAVGCGAYGLLMASLVGYPLPFTLFIGSPSWQVLFWACVLVAWGRDLRDDRALRSDVVSFYKVVVVQLSLTVVYPAYNHVFTSLDGTAQTVSALALPVLKMLAKNAFYYVFQHAEDFVPEVVIFNVEIFHALFVATCMQSSTSLSTTAVIMLADFVQAWVHIIDVDHMLRNLELLDAKTRRSESPSPPTTTTAATVTMTATPLTNALLYVGIDRSLQSDPSIRLEAMALSLAGHATPTNTTARAAIHPLAAPTAPLDEGPVVTDLRRLTRSFASRDLEQLKHALTKDERRTYVATVLRVLRFTEFLVLIEFVEVAVPLVYCSYLVAIARLPNRAFYPQLARMDNESLWGTVGSIVAYTALELASFVVLCVVLKRKMRFSPMRQLVFVLHKQWKLVQSKLVLWVVVIVGTSLEQFGYDYTFQFAWLKK